MLRFLIITLLFTSCVTSNKVRKFMLLHPEKAAELCLDQFPQVSTTDTQYIAQHDTIYGRYTDSIYSWMVENHFSEPVIKQKIKYVLKSVHDTVIIKEVKWDDRYKIMYEKSSKDYIILKDKYDRKSKSLFWTWLWLGIIGVVYIAYKRFL